jgi:ABC-type uncharacterized transport system substrate-binding protein
MEAGSALCAQRARAPLGSALARVARAGAVLAFVLTGCTGLPDPGPAEPLDALVIAPVAQLPQLPEAPAQVEPEPAPAPVAIIVSSRAPAYQDVADSLVEMLGSDEPVVRALDDPADQGGLIEAFADVRPRVVVAIGLDAALFAQANIDAPLVFCQVFNYSDYPELAEATAGVSMLAAFDEQLAFWRAVDDSLGVVGMIVGPGHEELIEESKAAAGSHGITLDARVADSDRETVYQFRRLAAEIDGFWLIPDNRILSVKAIEELMAYAAARRLPVVVSTPELLRFGALMSLKPSPRHVATTIFGILDRLQSYVTGGFEIVTPEAFDVDVNRSVAARLGIGID